MAWFPSLGGLPGVGLARRRQMPVFASRRSVYGAGLFRETAESERMVAAREGYDITIVRHDMTKPLPFQDGAFDLIFHPVLTAILRRFAHCK